MKEETRVADTLSNDTETNKPFCDHFFQNFWTTNPFGSFSFIIANIVETTVVFTLLNCTMKVYCLI